MLMSMRSVNKTSMRTCCKDCMHRKFNNKASRRLVKRSERQVWRRNVLKSYSK